MCLSFCELVSGRSRHFYDIFIFKFFLFHLFSCRQKSRWRKVVIQLNCIEQSFFCCCCDLSFSVFLKIRVSVFSPLWAIGQRRKKGQKLKICCTHCWFEKKTNKQKIRQNAQYDLGRGHWLFRTLLPKQVIRLLIRKLENYCLESPRLAYSLQMLPKYGHLFYWPERSKPKLQKCLHPLKPSKPLLLSECRAVFDWLIGLIVLITNKYFFCAMN